MARNTNKRAAKKPAKAAKRPQATRRKTVRKPLRERIKLPKVNIPLGRVVALLLMLAPVLLAIAAYIWINRPENLTIRSVEVTGELSHLTQADLQPVIEPFVTTNLFLLDSPRLEKELELNEWVYSVSLTKLWPDKLKIHIHEERPIAFWGEGNMLNEFGEIINADLPDKIGVLPVLYSPEDKGREMVENYLKLQEWMRDFPASIAEFREDSRGSWQLKLMSGLVINVGSEAQEKRLKRFVVGYRKELVDKIKKVHTVDLRYTNGFAVKWKSDWQLKQDARKSKKG